MFNVGVFLPFFILFIAKGLGFMLFVYFDRMVGMERHGESFIRKVGFTFRNWPSILLLQ